MQHAAFRLPQSIFPTSYAIELSADPSWPDFHGCVRIALDVRERTNAIVLHAKDLALDDAKLVRADGTTTALDIQVVAESEIARFTAREPIAPGQASLSVRFRGNPSSGMHGLYLARDGDERAICTQCEATDARAIFPCFDEPEFKATIQWTVRTTTGVIALANGSLLECRESNGGKIWRFRPTEPISTYLAAVAIGDFEGTDITLSGSTPIRVFAMRGKVRHARFAHELTEKLLPRYADYFGVPYPYGKYDQVAVPGFDAGAMENVGLVLFRQNLLLMDPAATSWNQEKLIANVIAHELAHMWFGNLVTMRWWDDLWLNEAFAEWFAHKAVDALEPNYLIWSDFQNDKSRALADDALPTTHPIWAPVDTPAQALEMFDVITYQKGCAVMRMLESFLGEDVFREGMRSYIRAFAGKNATRADLWQHLGRASNRPVAELMKSWIEQPGFPVVRYEIVPTANGTDLDLEQRRFFSSPSAASENCDQSWQIPVAVRWEDDAGTHEHRFSMSGRTQVERLPTMGRVRFCHANRDEIGFFRLEPGPTALALLRTAGPSVLSPIEQMGFVEDQWALVRNATRRIDEFIPTLFAFTSSPHHTVLRVVVDRLNTLDLLLEDSRDESARRGLAMKVANALSSHLEALGWEAREKDSKNDGQRRALLIHALGYVAGVDPVVETSCEYAERERMDARSVDANLAGVFLSIAAKCGDAARYERWMPTYLDRKAKGAAPQESARYLHSIAAFRPVPLTERTLGFIDDGTIPQESIGPILCQLLGARHSQTNAWSYVKRNWDTLAPRIGDMGIARVVESLGALEVEHRGEISSFFAAHPPEGAERALARAIERMDQYDELRKRVTNDLVAYFASR